MVQDLNVASEEIQQMCNAYGTPLQIYDGYRMAENAKNLIQTFTNHFQDFRQYFAVKALPNPAICKLLVDAGCGLDCSSTSELHLAKKLNVKGSDVMFTSNYTSKKDLGIAYDQGVIINLDDVSLVDALMEVRGKMPELICFRLNPGLGRTDSETKSNVLGGPDAKFGIPPNQIVEAYRKAKEGGSTRFGIHMMTGSCVMNNEYWTETARILFDTIQTIQDEVHIEFEFMNIGGGLGIPYRPEEEPVNVAIVAQMLFDVFDAASKKHNMKIPKLCMENGRYMTGPYGWLIARCQAIKKTSSIYYGLDASMAHLMRPGMYNAYHHITVLDRENDIIPANVVGDLCENNDWFAKNRLLPTAQVGDLFVIYDTGAHSHSMGFQYNGKLRAPEIILRKNHPPTLIRLRETIDDLYGNCREG